MDGITTTPTRGMRSTCAVDDDGRLAQDLWDNLLGLVFIRSAGTNQERQQLHALAAHWESLGYHVPMFQMNAEDMDGYIRHWHPNTRIDLTAPPFSLEQIF